jgi:hypothetical protein
MIFRYFLFIAAMVVGCRTAAADCRHDHIHWLFGESTTTDWYTDGTTCLTTMVHPDHIAEIKIKSRPAHGIAGKSGPFGVAYQPRPGFKGADHFVFVVTPNANVRSREVAIVKVNVYAGSQSPKAISRPSCETPYIPGEFGRSVATTWTIKNGSTCRIRNYHPEWIAKAKIVAKPQHGVAGNAGGFGIAYKPQPSFHGRDTFAYALTSNQSFYKGAGLVATVTVNVDVQ